uniref:MORN repeat-containing protein 3 n=1 Tax=Heliothis virescens TaxID=7102 RepID=A0A2A4J611_HELVI
MPFYHKPREFTPLLIAAEKKAKKNGLHHAIFTSRFDRYVGDWKNDLKEGMGRFLTIKGKLYEGEWYKGRRHGFGVLSQRQPNGTYSLLYRGDWVRGKPEGIGWGFFENGDRYVGFWKAGMLQGYGNYWYSDNTFYAGYFSNDMKDGFGLLLLENGNRYEGHWEKDLKSGLGRYYHMCTGQLQEGCWANDVCIMSKMTDIVIRQACDHPTPYPIPPHQLKFPRKILELSELWLKQKKGEIDKNLKACIDQV